MARERTTAIVVDMDEPDDECEFDEEPEESEEEPVDVRLELAGVPFN